MCVRVNAAVRARWPRACAQDAWCLSARACSTHRDRALDNNFSERSRLSVCGRRRRATCVSCLSVVVVMVVVLDAAVVVEEVV